jgi:hypothetical protein
MGYSTIGTQTSRYRLVTTNREWLEAQDDCVDDGTGTHLAVASSMQEHLDIADAISGASASVWVGASDRYIEALFIPVTGATTTLYVDWYTGASKPEPDNSGDCVEVVSSTAPQLGDRRKNFDEDCGESRKYICECDGVAADPNAY